MELFSSPLFLNILFYAVLALIAFIGIKGADGFFAVGIIYFVMATCGFFGPIVIGILNTILYFVLKDSGFLIGIGFAAVVFGLYHLYGFLDSRDFYKHHFAEKKIKTIFKESTTLEPNTHIHFVLDGGEYAPTKIFLKEIPTKEELALFETGLQTSYGSKAFEFRTTNDGLLQRVRKNA